MSTVGKLARGLLSGGAGYFANVADEQRKERESDALMMRQMALKRLDQQFNLEGKQVDQTNRIAFDDVQTSNKMVSTGAELGIRGGLAAQEDERKAAAAAADDVREFGIWLKKQPIELRNNLTMEDFKQDRTDRRTEFSENQQNRRSVVAKGVDAAGDVTYRTARGDTTTMRGMKPTPSGGDDLGFADAPPGQAAPSSAVTPQKTYTASDFNQALAEAGMLKAKGDPRFKDKTPAEIRQIIRDWFEEKGLRLSTSGD